MEGTIEIQRQTTVRGYPDQQNPEATVEYTAQGVPLSATVTRIVRETTYAAHAGGGASTPVAQSTRLSAAQQRQYEQERQAQFRSSHQESSSEQHGGGGGGGHRKYADHHDAHYHGRTGWYPSAIKEKLQHLIGPQLAAHKLLLPLLATLAIGTLLALFILILMSRRRGARTRRGKRTVLILGEPDSGKTALWSLLAKNQLYQSVASMTENSAPYYDRSRNAYVSKQTTTTVTKTQTKAGAGALPADAVAQFTLVDVPGHHRVRPTLTNKYKADAVAIIYVVNCATLKKTGWDVSNNLYDIMIDEQMSKLPLLVVCNRAEGDDAGDNVRQMLEANFNTIRKSHFNVQRKEYEGFLGNPNRDFAFNDLRSTEGTNNNNVRAPQFVVIPEWKERETWQADKVMTAEVRESSQIDRVSGWLNGI